MAEQVLLGIEAFSPSMRPYVQQVRAKERRKQQMARRLQEQSRPKVRFGKES